MAAPGAESTATFRCKALYLCVRSLRGREGAREFVQAIGAGRIFEDETKPISRELWIRALREFGALVGDTGFRRLSRYLVHPKNLGFWSVMLRGAHGPEDVYSKLDETGGDQDYGWTWRARPSPSDQWSGEVCFLESDSDDDRILIQKALSAELRAIPVLFGLAPAHVQSRVEQAREDEGRTEVVQTASWSSATKKTLQAGALATLFASLTVSMVVAVLGATMEQRIGAGLLAGILCLAVTAVLSRDTHYRAVSRAQHLRILALEREASLQKLRVKEISRPHEEPVIAGKYRLAEQLGVGASGAVWSAKRLTDGAEVAIKLLRTALAQDPRATDRLRREAQALGLSWHPHVVEVLDDGLLSSGVAFLVTELLSGETLAQRIRRLGRLEKPEVAQWALQATDALMAIHGAGIIHRDVKPENLFLHSGTSGVERLKLIDFGVAAVSWAETRLTRHGARVGTAGYAAPEQERGDEIDSRADLFALGQTLKEALTGEAPPTDESQLGKTIVGLSKEWSDVLDKLTAPLPADRFASARDARDAIAALEGGSAVYGQGVLGQSSVPPALMGK